MYLFPTSLIVTHFENLSNLSLSLCALVARTVKPDVPPQDLPLTGAAYLDSSSSTVPLANSKPSGPTPLFPVDGERSGFIFRKPSDDIGLQRESGQ